MDRSPRHINYICFDFWSENTNSPANLILVLLSTLSFKLEKPPIVLTYMIGLRVAVSLFPGLWFTSAS